MNSSTTQFKVTAGLLALALAIGGAGSSFPRLGMLLGICALGVAAYLLFSRRDWRLPRESYFALGVLGAVLLLPLLQLIPLPPSVWTMLPGRALPAEVDGILGWSQWRPLSLDVEATLRSFLNLLPAAVVFVCCAYLPRVERARLLWVVLAFAVASALLGIAQLTASGALTPYPSTHLGRSLGLFVNRNHHAAFLLAAVPIAAGLCAERIAAGKTRGVWLIACASAILVFALAILGTTSRMALILLPVSLAAALLLLFFRQAMTRTILPAILLVGALGTFLFARGGFDRTLARFSSTDPRFDYWADIQWALQHYGLAGTGIGTFIPVYKSAESLEAVVPAITNHAHNDYLELLLEGGIPAVLILVAFITLLGTLLFRRPGPRNKFGRPLTNGVAAAAIGLLLLFEAVDYPLRMPAVSAVFAVLCALLLPSNLRPPAPGAKGRPRAAARWIPLVAGHPVLLALSVLVVQAGMSSHLMSKGRHEAAARLAPWSTAAHEAQATASFRAGDLPKASEQSFAAIRLSPISVPGIRTAGLIGLLGGDGVRGNRLMQAAVILGWRDRMTQLWAIEAAIASKEHQKALQRADALFRQNLVTRAVIDRLLYGTEDKLVAPMVAVELAKRPPWRTKFLRAAGVPGPKSDRLVTIFALLKKSDAPPSLYEAQPFLDILVKAGKVAKAQRVWALVVSPHLISNGDFERLADRRGEELPEDWAITQANRSRVSAVEPDFASGTRALYIASSEGTRIASQELLLAPGEYRVSYKARVEDGGRGSFRWELRCHQSRKKQVSDASLRPSPGWQPMTFSFAVPAEECPAQRLAIVRAGENGPDQLWIDDLRIEPLSR